MRLLVACALCVGAAFILGPRVTHAEPSQELTQARLAFQASEFSRAIPLFHYLLYPDPRLSQREELIEAYLSLGVSYYETGDKQRAATEFEEALALEPTTQLTSTMTSGAAIEYFNSIKRELQRRLKDDEEKRRLAQERDDIKRRLDNLVVLEKRSRLVNMIPFGVGQFQNGHNRKATFFLISEAALGGTSAALFLWQSLKFGIGGQVPRADADTVRLVQNIQVASGAACVGLMIWGIIDGFVHYKSSIQLKASEADLKELPSPKPQPKPKPSSRIHLLPLATPDFAGVAMGSEF